MLNFKNTYTKEELKNILVKNQMTRTKAKISIINELIQAKHPISIQELHQKLGVKSCHLSTVFRTMQQFKNKNLVREINFGEDFCRYELITNDDKDHIRCRTCGTFEKIEKIKVKNFEETISKMGFSDMTYRLDLSGLCPHCIT